MDLVYLIANNKATVSHAILFKLIGVACDGTYKTYVAPGRIWKPRIVRLTQNVSVFAKEGWIQYAIYTTPPYRERPFAVDINKMCEIESGPHTDTVSRWIALEILQTEDKDMLCSATLAARCRDIIRSHCTVKLASVGRDDITLFPAKFPDAQPAIISRPALISIATRIPPGCKDYELTLPEMRPGVIQFMEGISAARDNYELPAAAEDLENLLALFEEIGISLQ